MEYVSDVLGTHMKINPIRTTSYLTLSFLAASCLALAQDAPDNASPQDQPQQGPAPSNGGWRRVGDPPPQQADRPPDRDDSYRRYPESQQSQRSDPGEPVPPQLTIKPGTFVTVRVDQWLSSDRNQQGDTFSATLVRPVVVDGVIVAQPGQMVVGRVAEAQKAGRVEGVSRLGLQMTELTLVDGQQLPIRSQLISRTGGTSNGRDAAAIGTTTAVGAAAGAAAGGGVGAGIGAGAGAVAGVIGVLLTRGHPTVVYPESVLTFRVDAPVTFSTERSAQAFRYVAPNDYDRQVWSEQPPPPQRTACAGYGCAPPPPAYYGYGYPGYGYPGYYGGYPYYYGTGLSFFWGPSFYGRGYYGRGYYRGGSYGRGYYGGGRGYVGGGSVGRGYVGGGSVGRGYAGGGSAGRSYSSGHSSSRGGGRR